MKQEPPQPVRRRFARLAQRADPEIDLGEGAFLIGAEEYPGLDVDRWLSRLDEMAAHLEPQIKGCANQLQRLSRLMDYLYVELGLRGNTEDYYDPRNSFLNQVLERRLGIPITLGVLCIEMGKRVGVPLRGVGFPAHFLVSHGKRRDLYIDPFDQGRLLDEQACETFLWRKTGGTLSFDSRYLEPVSNRQILLRILNNLKRVYFRRGELVKATAAIDRILLLNPEQPGELRERGLIRLRQQDYSAALTDLGAYLSQAPLAEDRPAIEHWMSQAEKSLIVN